MKTEINNLLNEYHKFIKDKTTIHHDTGTEWSVISTPFLGLFNDTIEIFIKKDGDKIILSDDGVTMHNLELCGVSISRSLKRQEFIDKIIINYGLHFENKEIIAITTAKDFASKKHSFISAVSEISDMYVLTKHNTLSMFKEDVNIFLQEQNLITTPQFIARGSSGLEFTFDFHIAGLKEEIVIKSFDNINKLSLSSFLFAWDDIKQTREKQTHKSFNGLAMINDERRDIKQEYLDAFINKNSGYILWSERLAPENIHKLQKTSVH